MNNYGHSLHNKIIIIQGGVYMARSSTIYNPSLERAVHNLLLKMKEAGYSEGTQHNTFKALRPIQTFMDSEGITDYSPQVGTNYLKSYFQIHIPSEHRKQSIIRYIELLNKSYAGIQIVKEKSRFIYNESLAELINGLIEQLRTMGFSEETLHNYMARLRPIQSYMRKNNIDLYSPEVGKDYYNYFLKTHTINETTKSELKASILRLNDFFKGVSFVRMHTFRKVDTIPICFKEDTDEFFNDSSIYSDSKSTFVQRTKALARFLTKCTLFSAHSISELTPQIVQMACRDVTDIDEWITIRQFLKLLAQKGKIENDLSTFVPKARREAKAPSARDMQSRQRPCLVVPLFGESGAEQSRQNLVALYLVQPTGDSSCRTPEAALRGFYRIGHQGVSVSVALQANPSVAVGEQWLLNAQLLLPRHIGDGAQLPPIATTQGVPHLLLLCHLLQAL